MEHELYWSIFRRLPTQSSELLFGVFVASIFDAARGVKRVNSGGKIARSADGNERKREREGTRDEEKRRSEVKGRLHAAAAKQCQGFPELGRRRAANWSAPAANLAARNNSPYCTTDDTLSPLPTRPRLPDKIFTVHLKNNFNTAKNRISY